MSSEQSLPKENHEENKPFTDPDTSEASTEQPYSPVVEVAEELLEDAEVKQQPAAKENSSDTRKESDAPSAPPLSSFKDASTPETKEELSPEELLSRMEQLINLPNAGEKNREFSQLREKVQGMLVKDIHDRRAGFIAEGGMESDFHYEHPLQARLSGLSGIFKEKHDIYLKEQQASQEENLSQRQDIIERLKNLYTGSEPGTNFFKEIREIKKAWSEAGQVAKAEFKLLNNNYFHHLNQFYQMLDLNKEYLHQEYQHNLEKREHIIERAKALLEEPVQKALNELQYLHKLWKEEAEPVAEEFREKTWEQFKELSNQIHDRKSELSAVLEEEQFANLTRKNAIIEKIRGFSEEGKNASHQFWQNAIKTVEKLREDFLKTGSVPRKLSNQNWNEFKEVLKSFNQSKNDFYKNLKGSQVENLSKKQKLVETARDNMHSEDWDTMVPLYKKLQQEWKQIGHVPRSQANKIWDEFKDACNTFFANHREKTQGAGDNWKENYHSKRALLESLKGVGNSEGSMEEIERIKAQWNAVGKVPRDKIAINTEFNKTLREKLRLNNANEYDLKDENLSESQLTDKARKIKNQIQDLEAEISTLENNLGFFNSPSRDNPLLKDTYAKIDEKKQQLEHLRSALHQIISPDGGTSS